MLKTIKKGENRRLNVSPRELDFSTDFRKVDLLEKKSIGKCAFWPCCRKIS